MTVTVIKRLTFLTFALLLLVNTNAEADTQTLTIFVTFEGKPLPGLHLSCHPFEAEGRISATTDSQGKAAFQIDKKIISDYSSSGAYLKFALSLSIAPDDDFSRDYVLEEDPTLNGSQMNVIAQRSAEWQIQANPRICDRLGHIQSIMVGYLYNFSAEKYNSWYSSLSATEIENCQTLTQLQEKVGSSAPWYYYAFKGEMHWCEEDGTVSEIDWAARYRKLLEEETGSNPGHCVNDWDQWWKEKGYDPVPDNPCWQNNESKCHRLMFD